MTMDHYHVQWTHPLFLWPFSMGPWLIYQPGISPFTMTLQRGIEVVRGDSHAAIELWNVAPGVVDQIICRLEDWEEITDGYLNVKNMNIYIYI